MVVEAVARGLSPSNTCFACGRPSRIPAHRTLTVGGPARLGRSPAALVDLLAILPFYLLLFEPTDLRVFGLLRLVRFFKLSRYSSGLATLVEALYANGMRCSARS